jgi:hypothetical protein
VLCSDLRDMIAFNLRARMQRFGVNQGTLYQGGKSSWGAVAYKTIAKNRDYRRFGDYSVPQCQLNANSVDQC